MKKELSHIFTQVDAKGFDQSDLIIKIEAEIDTAEQTAEFTQLISITAYDFKTGVYTDLTNIFFNCFHDEAEAVINKIDWWAVFKENRTVAA